MPYEVVVWCQDCTGIDFDGCFLGGTEVFLTDPNTSLPIATRERAEDIGWDFTKDCAPWFYEINEVPIFDGDELP